MHVFVTALYCVAAILVVAFACAELRLLVRFLRNRESVRAGVGSRRGAAPAPVGAGAGARGTDADAAPTVTVQLPLYNERLAARQVVLAAADQCYPADRFDIQVLDDSTDETSAVVEEVVREVRARGIRIEHIRRSERVGYKAGALAEGLRRSDADFVAVFDADFSPGPDFLRRVLLEERPFEDEEVAFVQARWEFSEADGLFRGGLALLLDRHFYIQKPARAFARQVTTFNGSAGVWRRSAIDAVGGWSADTLTEDLDLSYRCALAGWRGRYLRDVGVPNEIPGHMRAFKLQQRRWSRGSAQCFRKLRRRVMASGNGLRDRWEELFLLAGYAVHPVLLANLLLWPWAVLYADRAVFWPLQALMGAALLVAPVSFVVTLLERGERLRPDVLARLAAGLCIGIGLMVNNTVGQLQGYLAGGGEFGRTPKGGALMGAARASSRDAIMTSSAGLRSGAGLRSSGGLPPSGGLASSAGLTPSASDGSCLPLLPYRSPLHWTFFAEVAVIAYCLLTAGLLLARGAGAWAVPLLFWATCIGLVAQLQLTPQTV